MDGALSERERVVMGTAASHFGRDVVSVEPLNSTAFSSFRVRFSNEAVIATQRRNFRSTHLEAMILEQMSPLCDDMPRYLGMTDGILFQSDLGGTRLDIEVLDHEPADQIELAAEACASIFRIQSAARQSGVVGMVPKIGTTQEWMENLVGSVDALQLFSRGIPENFDYQAVADKMVVSKRGFVKWHCRPNYAIICDDGFLRWNGFEMSGARHGAEDLAWLMGDERWPLEPDDMMQIVRDTFDPNGNDPLEQYIDYLSVYTALHCVQRFKIIVRDAQENGWHSKNVDNRKENPGVDTVQAKHLCEVGAFFADRCKLTRDLVPNFEQTARAISAIGAS